LSGSVSYHAGLCAESIVERLYLDRGYAIAARRYRTRHGELDLIAEKDAQLIFIEVKKSATHARAAERVSARQMKRLFDLPAEPDRVMYALQTRQESANGP